LRSTKCVATLNISGNVIKSLAASRGAVCWVGTKFRANGREYSTRGIGDWRLVVGEQKG
jgi:hypothetical protein